MVEDYLAKEVMERRVVEITNETSMPGLQISLFSVTQKKSSPGNWRLIIDLSSPDLHSANDGIPKELCSLLYCSVDDVVRQVLQLGKGAKLVAKLDVKNAFRLLLVHPWHVLERTKQDTTIWVQIRPKTVQRCNQCLGVGLDHLCRLNYAQILNGSTSS